MASAEATTDFQPDARTVMLDRPHPMQAIRVRFEMYEPYPNGNQARALEGSLRQVDGILDAYVNLTTHSIALRCDAPRCDPGLLVEALQQAHVSVGRASVC